MFDYRDLKRNDNNVKFCNLVQLLKDFFGSEETAVKNNLSFALVLNFIPSLEKQQSQEVSLEQFKNMSQKSADEIINSILNT